MSAYAAFEDAMCGGLTLTDAQGLALPLSGSSLDVFISSAAVLVAGWSKTSEQAARSDPSLKGDAIQNAYAVVLQFYLAVCQSLPVGNMLSVITDQLRYGSNIPSKIVVSYLDCLHMVNDDVIIFK